MLTELQVSNFALIEEQSISFSPGLNVISGETGAGKSILLHAIELILGGRPKAHMLRAGAESGEVQALFSLETIPDAVRQALPEFARGEDLAISRTFSQSGRGKVYLNGKIGTVALLEEVVSKFVNICGQNQHVKLLNRDFHRDLLDGFARNEDLLVRYRAAYEAWKTARDAVADVEVSLSRNVTRRAELEFIIAELGEVDLHSGVRAELECELKRYSHAESLIKGTHEILSVVEDEAGITSSLQQISSILHDLERFDPKIKDLASLFISARTDLEEFVSDLRRYATGVEVNEDLLGSLRDKLAEVARLERKYRMNDEGLVSLLERSKRELAMIDGSLNIEAIKEDLEKKLRALRVCADDLTQKRLKAGKTLVRSVETELLELSMAGAKLDLVVTPREFGPDGQEDVEFLISPNKGEPPKPLRQIASGGELARIMLVMKKILKDRTGVNVLVFDEVDTGVSGAVARAVGEKLQDLASGSQVICITHLPQVASLADQHILVEKEVRPAKKGEAPRTVSVLRVLEEEERVDEIARMLAGREITKASRASARELMRR